MVIIRYAIGSNRWNHLIYDCVDNDFDESYITKAEYQPVREELEEIIKRTQIYMRKQFHATFQFKLIGSGKRHLVTRIVNGNGGYDFDYNLILPAPEDGYHYKADVVKAQFPCKVALRRFQTSAQ